MRADDLLTALFPVGCAGCGVRGAVVCPDCRAHFAPAPLGACPAGLSGLGAALAYEGVARELVARVKYRNHRAALPLLGELAAGAAGQFTSGGFAAGGLSVVTWAPTTPQRCRARGFDHAELLARRVGRHLGLPVRRLLVRGPGPAQTGRSAVDRLASVHLRARPGAARQGVLVVDDVLTTGATLTAAAAALRAAGAQEVFGTVVARTP